MSFWDDLKQEAKDALPEVRDVVKKELQNQVSKRVNAGASAQPTTPIMSPAMQNQLPMILMAMGAVVAVVLILKKR